MPADPLWINASSGAPAYDGAELRRAMAMLLVQGVGDKFGARNGVHPGGGNAVTLSGSTVTILHTKAVVYPGLTPTAGPYIVQLPSRTHTVPTADPTNPRKDIVVMRVWDDAEDLSGLRQADTEYLTGTPAASPAEPSVPAGAFKMATIDVPAGGTGTLTYSAPFTVANGGILPVRNSGERPTLGIYDGFTIFQQDTSELLVRYNSAWNSAAKPPTAYTTYTPTFTNIGAATFSTRTGWWRYVDYKTVFFTAYFVVSTAGTGSNNVSITAPTSIDRTTRQFIPVDLEVGGAPVGKNAHLCAFTGGAGAVFDRIRWEGTGTTNGLSTMTGSDLSSGMIATAQGIYREA